MLLCMIVDDRNPDPLLTLRDAAGVLKVSVATVRRYAAHGEIQTVRLGRGPAAPVRIKPRALNDFIEDRSQ